MKYTTTINQLDIQIIKEFTTLDSLNNYYGLNIKETDKFPIMKEYVNEQLVYMIINKLD